MRSFSGQFSGQPGLPAEFRTNGKEILESRVKFQGPVFSRQIRRLQESNRPQKKPKSALKKQLKTRGAFQELFAA